MGTPPPLPFRRPVCLVKGRVQAGVETRSWNLLKRFKSDAGPRAVTMGQIAFKVFCLDYGTGVESGHDCAL